MTTTLEPVSRNGHSGGVRQATDGAVGASVVDEHDLDGDARGAEQCVHRLLEPRLGAVRQDDRAHAGLSRVHRRARPRMLRKKLDMMISNPNTSAVAPGTTTRIASRVSSAPKSWEPQFTRL